MLLNNLHIFLLAALSSRIYAEEIGKSFEYGFEKSVLLSSIAGEYTKLYWTTNQYDGEITFGVVVETVGWVGIGFSDNGSMKGADLAIMRGSKQSNGSDAFTIEDYYSTDNGAPTRDPDHHQNYILLESLRNNSHSAFKFKRLLTTCDSQDVDFGIAPLYVLYALGSTDELKFHRTSGAKLVSFVVNDLLKQEPAIPTDRIFELSATSSFSTKNLTFNSSDVYSLSISSASVNYNIPTLSTSTACLKFNLTERIGIQPLYYTGFSATSDKYTRHARLLWCNPASFAKLGNIENNCPTVLEGCVPILSWSRGMDYTSIPDGVAGRLGGSERSLIVMQLNFVNAKSTQNAMSKFSFKIFAQMLKPKYDLGSFSVAVPTEGIIIPVGSGTTNAATECPSECTTKFPSTGIKVFSTTLRANSFGKRLKLRIIREGKELQPISSVNSFDSDTQSMKITERVILQGDRLLMECEYSGDRRNGKTNADQNEACVGEITFYPDVSLRACATSNLNPERSYCGNDLSTAIRNISSWPNEDVVTISKVRPPFTEIIFENDLCHRLNFAGSSNPMSWETWSIPVTIYLLVSIFIMYFIGFILPKVSKKYRMMSVKHQQNVKVYIYSTVVLTLCLLSTMAMGASALIGQKELIVADKITGKFQISTYDTAFLVAMQMVGVVMLVEMCFKMDIDLFMTIHHTLTVSLMCLLFYGFYLTLDSIYPQLGLLLSLHATTEQPIYLTLLFHRFRSKSAKSTERSAFFFFLSAIYMLICKTILASGSLLWCFTMKLESRRTFNWISMENFNHFNGILLPILIILLYFVQIRQISILLAISKNIRKGIQEDKKIADSAPKIPVAEVSQLAVEEVVET